MLIIGCHPGVRGHSDVVGQHHVVGTDPFDGKKIVIIKVLVNTSETDRFGRRHPTDFSRSDTYQRFGYPFIFTDAPAGNKPEVLCRPVAPFAQQDLGMRVAHDQVDRNQRRGVDNF